MSAGIAKIERLEARAAEASDISTRPIIHRPLAPLFRQERWLRPISPPRRRPRNGPKFGRPEPRRLREDFAIVGLFRFKREPDACDIAVVAQDIDLS
jgi:hypothetical protein